MLKVFQEKNFKKEIKKFQNNLRIRELINEVIIKLANQEKLDKKYKNHLLKGEWINCFDCHILPDLVLIYQLTNEELKLVRIGSHSELF